jgi:hypothetical protein
MSLAFPDGVEAAQVWGGGGREEGGEGVAPGIITMRKTDSSTAAPKWGRAIKPTPSHGPHHSYCSPEKRPGWIFRRTGVMGRKHSPESMSVTCSDTPSLFLCFDGLGPLACSHSELILNIINLTRSFRINFLLLHLFIYIAPIYIYSISYSPFPSSCSDPRNWVFRGWIDMVRSITYKLFLLKYSKKKNHTYFRNLNYFTVWRITTRCADVRPCPLPISSPPHWPQLSLHCVLLSSVNNALNFLLWIIHKSIVTNRSTFNYCFWTLSIALLKFKTHNDSEIGFWLRLDVKTEKQRFRDWILSPSWCEDGETTFRRLDSVSVLIWKRRNNVSEIGFWLRLEKPEKQPFGDWILSPSWGEDADRIQSPKLVLNKLQDDG